MSRVKGGGELVATKGFTLKGTVDKNLECTHFHILRSDFKKIPNLPLLAESRLLHQCQLIDRCIILCYMWSQRRMINLILW